MSLSEGGSLARLQIASHGQDRYPTPHAQAEKAVIEAAELLGAVSEHDNGRCLFGPVHSYRECPRVRSELADAGLALYELANKADIDLIAAMRELVDADQRRFA
jgi:hypothetical protein